MTTKGNPSVDRRHTQDIPALSMLDLPRRWFIAPGPIIAASQGGEGRQPFAIYNLESGASGAFSLFFKECLATVPAGKAAGLAPGDADNTGPTDRWWLLNEILERGGRVVLWSSQQEAVAAVATLNGNASEDAA